MNKKSLLAVIISAFTLLPAHADDFGLWTDAGLSQKLGNTGLTADVGLGMRLNNNWNNIDRWNLGVALSYDIFKFLETSVGYDLIYSFNQSATKPNYNTAGVWRGYNVENAYWRPKNRLHVDLKGKAKVGRFSFSLRERYQLTAYNHRWLRQDKYRFNQGTKLDGTCDYLYEGNPYVLRDGYPESEMELKEHKTKHYLRSRLQASYDIRNVPIAPYIAWEVSNNLSEGFSIDKRRYSVGADWKITKGQHLSIGYVYNNGEDDDEDGNLHAIEVSYKIKGLFWKAPSKKSKK